MPNRWLGAVFVCSSEVDLDKLVRAVRQQLGDAEGADEVSDAPDGLPMLNADLRLPREVVQGVGPLVVAAPFPGRALWAISPPQYDPHDDDPYPLTAEAAAEVFPGATVFVAGYHGSTGTERVLSRSLGEGELEDDGSDTKDQRPALLAGVARQLDVSPADLRAAIDGLDLRADAVKVPLDEVDAAKLKDAAAKVVAAMGASPRKVTPDLKAAAPVAAPVEAPKAEVVPPKPPEPDEATRRAEAAAAQSLRTLGMMAGALLLMVIVFAIMAASRG